MKRYKMILNQHVAELILSPAMTLIELGKDIFQLELKDSMNTALNINITFLLHGRSLLMIDSGYAEHGRLLKEFIQQNQLNLEILLLSHYHPDHAAGAAILNPSYLGCSEKYYANYETCSKRWDPQHEYFKPTVLLKDGQIIEFYNHRIRVHYSGGHSTCSVVYGIDDLYCHVGDLVMRDVNDQMTFPCISQDGSVDGYARGFESLKQYNNPILLLSHGHSIKFSKVESTLENYVRYLNEVRTGKLSKQNIGEYLGLGWAFQRWHVLNCKYAV